MEFKDFHAFPLILASTGAARQYARGETSPLRNNWHVLELSNCHDLVASDSSHHLIDLINAQKEPAHFSIFLMTFSNAVTTIVSTTECVSISLKWRLRLTWNL